MMVVMIVKAMMDMVMMMVNYDDGHGKEGWGDTQTNSGGWEAYVNERPGCN